MPKAKPAETPDDAAVTITPPINKLGSRKKKAVEEHTVTRKWAEEVPVDKPTPKAVRKPAPIEVIDDDDSDAEDDELDGLDELLSEYGNNAAGLMMEISRLPNYDVDGRTDPAARSYVTERPFDRAVFLQDLSVFCAKPNDTNVFLLRLKRDKKYVANGVLGPFRVEPASAEDRAKYGIKVAPEPQPASVTVTQAVPVQHYPPPIDIDAEFEKRMAWVERFEKMARRHEAPQPAAQSELTEEAILLKAAMASNEAKEKIANGIGKLVFGGASEAVDDKEPYWFQPAFSLFSNILQGITPGLNALLQVTAQAKQVQLQQVQQPVISSAEGLATIPAPMPEAVPQAVEPLPPTAPTMMDLYAIAFNAVLEVRKLPAPLNLPRKAARALLDLADNNSIETPNGPVSPFDSVITDFLETEPEQLLTLAETFAPESVETIKAPDAVEWVKAVQDELRKEWSDAYSEAEPQK